MHVGDSPAAADTLIRMFTGPRRHDVPRRRRALVRSGVTGVLAVFALLAATLAVLVAGSQSATAASGRTTGQAVRGHEPAGHQPSQLRVTATDRTDVAQHRAVPWTPVSVAPQVLELTRPAESSRLRQSPADTWVPFHATPAQGRAPPR